MRSQVVFAFALVAVVFTSTDQLWASQPPATRSRNDLDQSASNRGPKRSGAERLIAAVNRYRARYKLSPLKADPILTRVARQRAPFLDAHRSASGPGYNHHACGQWSRQHVRQEGFAGPATDNLAMGYPTPEDAVKGWADEDHDRDPAGHNFQMRGLAQVNGRWVDEGYNRIGVGIVGRKYIAIFGRHNPKPM